MLPAPLKKLGIYDIAPVTADRLYFRFHLRSGDSQKPSTIALWTRGDKKPFPSVKLGHYAHTICVLDDGRLVAIDADRSSILEGLTPAPFETPRIEDVTWSIARMIEGELVLGGSDGALQRRAANGTWTDLSKLIDKQHIGGIAAHPSGGFVISGSDGLLARVTSSGATPVRHELGTAAFFDVLCRADGTIAVIAERNVVLGSRAIAHPESRGSFSSLVEVRGQLFISATNGLYRLHDDGKLEAIACPVAPPPFSGASLCVAGDALVAFNEDSAQFMHGTEWSPIT